MSDPKKVALFVDVENVYLGLRNMYNRELGPELLVEKAKTRGEPTALFAYADWKELPEGLADKFKANGFETTQVDRVIHSRELNNKRREVVKDMIPVEMLAGMVTALVDRPAIEAVMIASGERSLVPAARLAREKFSKEVYVCAIPGSAAKELETAATALDPLEVPPLEPVDEEGLSKLVPLMEELERRKRYLNFKYIRESVVRHGELKAKTFDEAERLLSDAIACGLVLKQKVEDKYHPGQLFTAYALNRESALWKKYGNGLPAPVRTEEDEAREAQQAAAAAASAAPAAGGRDAHAGVGAAPVEGAEMSETLAAAPSGPAPALPTFTASRGAAPEREGGGGEPRESGDPRDGGRRGRRGRRGRGGREQGGERREPAEAGAPREPRPERDPREHRRDERRSERPQGRGPDKGRANRPQRNGRDGRRFESVSRLFRDPNAQPVLNDDEVDEERILRARGDMDTRRID